MKLGIVTPVVTRLPDAHARVGGRARASPRSSASSSRPSASATTTSPAASTSRSRATLRRARGGTYWDPLAVVRLPRGAHDDDPLRDLRARARLPPPARDREALRHARRRVAAVGSILGVGVGSLEEEFELLGAEFDDRGARGDDAIRCDSARRSARAEPEYHGTHYSFDGFVVRAGRRPGATCRSGSAAARRGRCGGPSSSATRWAPFGLSRRPRARCSSARA